MELYVMTLATDYTEKKNRIDLSQFTLECRQNLKR